MFENAFLALGPLGLLIAGYAVLWLVSHARQEGRAATGRLGLMWTVVGEILLALGILSIIVITTHYLALIVAPVAAVVLLMAVRMYRDAERQSLLWMLTAAAERGIPLETAARAFARERSDSLAVRADNLADYLEAGVPLSLALRRSHNSLPSAALLAADLGAQTGTLGPALRQVVGQMDEFELTVRSTWEKFVYFAFLLFFGSGVLAHLMVYVVPNLAQIFDEFDLPLPTVTICLIGVSRFLVELWYVLLPLVAVLLLLLLIGSLHYAGISPHKLPIVGRLWRRVDSALVMRWLAIAVRQNRPIAETVRLLAEHFPQAALRTKLDLAAGKIDQGANWCESLQVAGLIKRFESVVFRSAERAGNLAWALDEMADSSTRRSAHRLRAWLSVAFPSVVLAFGGGVFFIAFGMMAPLLSLIRGFSG